MILLKLIKNKYFLTVVALLTWLFFFDKNDFYTQYETIKKLHSLENEQNYYLKEIENNKRELNELQTNLHSLEKFAREKYLMKKDDEDVFVFVTK
ncbi:MAG: septum formation initiator family protein [Bacteroidia bacterium]